jgi:hypothetical protein
MRMLMAKNQVEDIISALPDSGTLLEWGSGGTTLEFLRRMTSGQRLVSIEHNTAYWTNVKREAEAERDESWPEWLYLMPEIRPEVVKHHCQANAKIGEESPAGLEHYMRPPEFGQLEGAVDVILVDGIARGCCISVARNLFPTARIFLHDSTRYWYDWALVGFTGKRVIEPDKGDYQATLAELIR